MLLEITTAIKSKQTGIILDRDISTGPEYISSISYPLSSLSYQLKNAVITSEVLREGDLYSGCSEAKLHN